MFRLPQNPTVHRVLCLAGWLIGGLLAGGRAPAAIPGARPGAEIGAGDHAFLEELQRASFRFFEEQTHPRTGLVADRARATGGPMRGKASIASSGFAFTGWVIAAERGWVPRAAALERVRLMLRFLAHEAPRRQGFFYHFMEPDTGARAWECEISPIDTSLCLFGALVAREYFADAEVTSLVDGLYRDMDWPWFLNGGDTLASSWRDETGFSRYRWRSFSEHLGMNLVALGSPAHPLPAATWPAWQRSPTLTYGGRHFLAGGPLFIHQFSHAYVDFRDTRDAFADYYRNSVLATLAQREFCRELSSKFPSWGEKLWGVTASDSARGYLAWGGPPRSIDGGALDGTLVPCAAAGSLPFAPPETLLTLRHMRTVYGEKIWRRYGFVDAFNPDSGWVAPDVIGLDVGISLVQAENARTGLVWALFMRAPEVRRGLARAGFVSTSTALNVTATARLHDAAAGVWRTLAATPVATDTAGLQLGALLAARSLGFADDAATLAAARAWLRDASLPAHEDALAPYAAALLTLRQAVPALAADATARLQAIRWPALPATATELGSRARLGVFLRIALHAAGPEAWRTLARTPVALGPVHVLAPAVAADQRLPGLWLDERTIITGASAAQFAYARRADASDPLDLALLAEHLPAAADDRLADGRLNADTLAAASLRDRAALLVALANTRGASGGVRHWFQQDPGVQAARTAIDEFAEAAFGPDNSLFARRELAGPDQPPPPRRAVVRRAGLPPAQWDWQTVEGLSFLDSPADRRADDPALSLRFAFAWDESALHFRAVAIDTPRGTERPARRREAVELLLDPRGDGFTNDPADDAVFSFLSSGGARDVARGLPLNAEITRQAEGYSVEVRIPWERLGLRPAPGLRLGATAAVQISGPRSHFPSVKLTWRRHVREDGTAELGTLILEP